MIRIALWTLLALNLVAFVLVGLDKRAARRGGRRIPEAALLLFAWLGGFVGGYWGMGVFRHKTKKTSFKVKMVLATILSPAWLVAWRAIA